MAPPRLRGKAAQLKYGERAAELSGGSAAEPDASDEELGLKEPVASSTPSKPANGAAQGARASSKALPIVR